MFNLYKSTFTTKSFYSFLTILLLSIALLSGCSKKDNNPAESGNPSGINNSGNSITVNGDGYTNQLFELANNTVAMAQYDPSENRTACTFIVPGSIGASVAIYFRSGQAGTYKWDNVDAIHTNATSALVLTIGSGSTAKQYISLLNSGSTIVSNYGSVGKTISGTFNGTLYNVVDSTKSVTVTGKFNTTRQVDAQ